MDRTTAVWLGLSVVSLFSLAVVSLLKLLHTYRQHWRPLDVLLVALLAADVSSAVLALGLALLSLIRGSLRPDQVADDTATGPICSALVCGWSAAHTLQAALLTTLMLDRTCLLRWPYKYRLSVRRSHVRYHVVVVAIISILVGVAAVFAGTDSSSHSSYPTKIVFNVSEPVKITYNHTEDSACAFLPHVLDKRFNLVWLCLHTGLLLATLAGCVTVLVAHITAKLKGQPLGSGSDLRTLGTCASGSDNTSRGSGTLPFTNPRYASGPFTPPAIFGSEKMHHHHHHHPHQQHQHQPPMQELAGLEILPESWIGPRHSTVAAILVLAYVTYHLPLLVLSIMGSFYEEYLPNWPYSATVLGLGVTQLIFLVVLMTSVDPAFRHWMSLSLKPKPKPRPRPAAAVCPPPLHKEIAVTTDEEERFRLGLYNHEPNEVKFPLTNGSLFASLMATDNQGLTNADNKRGRDRKTSRMGVSAYEHRRHSHAHHHGLLNSFGPISLPDSLNQDTLRSSSLSSFGKIKVPVMSSPPPLHSIEPLYSDPLPSLESTPEKIRIEPIYATLSETLGSCGTLISLDNNSDIESVDANDDFVFHDTRTSRQNLNEVSEVEEVEEAPQVENSEKRVKITRSSTYRILCNGLETFVVNTKTASESAHGLVTCVSSLPVGGNSHVAATPDAPPPRGLITSLSMNDLDMVDDSHGQELLVTVPVKSDSMLSLYHIASSNNQTDNKPQDPSLEAAPKSLRSSIELAKYQWDDKQRLRPPTRSSSRPSILNEANLAKQPNANANAAAHYRKRSHRGRTAVLKRFQQRQLLESRIATDGMPSFVSIEHLSLALTQSPVAYMDNGEEVCISPERKTVFVSEYL